MQKTYFCVLSRWRITSICGSGNMLHSKTPTQAFQGQRIHPIGSSTIGCIKGLAGATE